MWALFEKQHTGLVEEIDHLGHFAHKVARVEAAWQLVRESWACLLAQIPIGCVGGLIEWEANGEQEGRQAGRRKEGSREGSSEGEGRREDGCNGHSIPARRCRKEWPRKECAHEGKEGLPLANVSMPRLRACLACTAPRQR